MSEQIRISAKNLGAAALPDFCSRCFWIKLRMEFHLPYDVFPGIFSSIDAYTKRIVHGYFDRHGSAPKWLDCLGSLTAYKDLPHYTKFKFIDEPHNILLRGTPDGIFVRSDGSHVIVDYKTAKLTNTQDELLPMYKGQLNAYARIGEHCGLSPVSGLALIYFEPLTDAGFINDEKYRRDGFALGFSSHVVPVDLDPEKVDSLLARTREIYEEVSPPKAREGCKDCERLDLIIDALDVEAAQLVKSTSPR